MGLLIAGVGVSLTLWPAPGMIFLPSDCLGQPRCKSLCLLYLIVSCCILLYLVVSYLIVSYCIFLLYLILSCCVLFDCCLLEACSITIIREVVLSHLPFSSPLPLLSRVELGAPGMPLASYSVWAPRFSFQAVSQASRASIKVPCPSPTMGLVHYHQNLWSTTWTSVFRRHHLQFCSRAWLLYLRG